MAFAAAGAPSVFERWPRFAMQLFAAPTGTNRPLPSTIVKSPPPRLTRAKPPLGQQRVTRLWWIVFLLVMVWNLWSFLPKPRSEAALPYSAFVAQVTAGNVTQTRIVGDQISGTFVHALQWPEAISSASTKDGAAEKNGAPPPPSYPGFRTTFPSVVGDPLLMPLLQAHHLVIDAASPSESWVTIALTNGLPVGLLGGLLLWMGRPGGRCRHRARRRPDGLCARSPDRPGSVQNRRALDAPGAQRSPPGTDSRFRRVATRLTRHRSQGSPVLAPHA